MGCSDEGGSRGTAPHFNWSSLQGHSKKSKRGLRRGDPKVGWGLCCWTIVVPPPHSFLTWHLFSMFINDRVTDLVPPKRISLRQCWCRYIRIETGSKNVRSYFANSFQNVITNKVLIQVKCHPSSKKKIHVQHVRSWFYGKSEQIPDAQTFWFRVSGWKFFKIPSVFSQENTIYLKAQVFAHAHLLAVTQVSRLCKRLRSQRYHKNVEQFYNQR